MPVVSVKAKARITAIFFMAVPLVSMWMLPEHGKDIRDSHHVLELFDQSRPVEYPG
jgi:hypothetical protein